MASIVHLFAVEDGKLAVYPVCGQANTHSGSADRLEVTCKRCLKRSAAAAL
jgi:hypothetical protein